MNTLHNKKVVIMGLGIHGGGVSSALFFARAGARVLVTDLQNEEKLKESLKKLRTFRQVIYVLGRHRKTDFKTADLIIRNPAVRNESSFLQIARKQGIPVHTDISWFMENALKTNLKMRNSIIGITGTKGKSTTAALLYHILKTAGKKALLAGNIRKSPLDFLKIHPSSYLLPPADFIILELSSWHLESLAEHTLAPHIAIITNIMKDHLNRYSSFGAYAKAKKSIYTYQSKQDVLFLNAQNDQTKKIARLTSIHPRIKLFLPISDAILTPKHVFIHPSALGAAVAIASFVKINKSITLKAVKTFQGIEGRLQKIAVIKGVSYYNDTCATQPDATIFALEKVANHQSQKKCILIAGGKDKNLNFKDLAKEIKNRVRILILFNGTASNKIIQELKAQKPNALSVFSNMHSMKQAVSLAGALSTKGDDVLLSPAAASFGLFKHEFDRGAKFVREVKKLVS